MKTQIKRSFAIGIPTLNRLDLLVNALVHYTREFPNVKIFVLDNGAQKIESCHKNITIFETEKNFGVAASWNKLVYEIFKGHEYALILNDDIILETKEYLLAKLIEKSRAGLIMCESEPGFTGFTSFVLPKKTFLEIGGFDETFYPAYFEDNDYLYRLKLNQIQVQISSLLNPEKMVRAGTQTKDPSIDLRINQNRNYYSRKWGGCPGKEFFTQPFVNNRMRKKKILWVTEYLTNTGYSRVSEEILKYLSQEYDITVVDTLRILEGQYEVLDYPAGKSKDPVHVVGKMFGGDTLATEKIKMIYQDYDVVFMIHDIWHINFIIEAMKKTGKPLPALVAYFPVDCADHDRDWYSNFEFIDAAVTYTEFARQEVETVLTQLFTGQRYAEQTDKIKIITHGIDHETFYRLPMSKNEIREKAFKTDRFNDDFIFLNANRNAPRKKPELTMDAFCMLLQVFPHIKNDTRLYMHCGNEDRHINIAKYAQKLGITENLIMSFKETGIPMYTDEQLNMVYNACDVGINTSIGEGFGLVNAEHAATGAPQIVPNHSALKEHYSEIDRRGMLIPILTDTTMTGVMTTGRVIDANKLTLLMYNLISDKKLYQEHGKNLREYFTGSQFNWANIAKSWIKVFDSF